MNFSHCWPFSHALIAALWPVTSISTPSSCILMSKLQAFPHCWPASHALIAVLQLITLSCKTYCWIIVSRALWPPPALVSRTHSSIIWNNVCLQAMAWHMSKQASFLTRLQRDYPQGSSTKKINGKIIP